jgi:RNAse (barnase) inhibitor barstar
VIREIELEAEQLKDRTSAYEYLETLFHFDEPCHNLDALHDSLSEVSEECNIILKKDAVEKICSEPYAYKILMVIGKACEENPNLHILFR